MSFRQFPRPVLVVAGVLAVALILAGAGFWFSGRGSVENGGGPSGAGTRRVELTPAEFAVNDPAARTLSVLGRRWDSERMVTVVELLVRPPRDAVEFSVSMDPTRDRWQPAGTASVTITLDTPHAGYQMALARYRDDEGRLLEGDAVGFDVAHGSADSTGFKAARVGLAGPRQVVIHLKEGRTERGVIQPFELGQRPLPVGEGERHDPVVDEQGTLLGLPVSTRPDLIRTYDRFDGERLDVDVLESRGWTISSSTDERYRQARSVGEVHVFTRPAGGGLDSDQESFWTRVHDVVLEVPEPLSTGHSYTVEPPSDAVAVDRSDIGRVGGSASRSIRFSLDEQSTVSPSIRLNQLGYAPGDRPKSAYLDRWLDGVGDLDWLSSSGPADPQQEPIRFEVRRVGDSGPAVYTAPVPATTISSAAVSAAIPDEIPPPIELDFSSVDETGRFQVCVSALGCSLPFDIGEDVWRRAAVTVARAAYHQRSGLELGPPFTAVNRPRGYHPDDGETVEASAHTMAMARANPGSDFDDLAAGGTGELVDDAWGGHFDAGDWDRRIDHLYYTRTVADLVRRYPATVASWRLNIPESDDGVPDVLDEGLWSLDLYRRMQRSDGAIRGGIEASEHPMYGATSWTDDLAVYAYEPDRWSSYLYASVAAEVAHTLGPYDRGRADDYLQSAIAAMEWAESKVAEGAGTDPSGEAEPQRNVAAAALLLATGEERWHRLFIETADYLEPGADTAMSCHVHTVCDAAWLYLEAAGWDSLPPGDAEIDGERSGDSPSFEPDTAVVAELRGRFLASADELLEAAHEHAYGWTTEHPDVPLIWGLGAGGAPKGAGLLKAYQLSGDERYRRAVLRSASVGLGANPLGQVFLTGIGHNPVRHPVIIDNLNGGIPLWPGTPVYGFHDLGWGPDDDWAVEYFLRPAGARPDPDELPYLWQWYDLNSMPFFNEFTLHQSHAEALRVFATLHATRGDDGGG